MPHNVVIRPRWRRLYPEIAFEKPPLEPGGGDTVLLVRVDPVWSARISVDVVDLERCHLGIIANRFFVLISDQWDGI